MCNFKTDSFMQYDFKYADLLDDDVFKLVFGRESTKDVMIEFLNQVIPDRRITDLEFIDKEMHPVERDLKGTVYDMFCKTDDGSRIIVEVQRRKQPFYPEREEQKDGFPKQWRSLQNLWRLECLKQKRQTL